MANPNTPFGAKPLIRAGGAPFSVTEYCHTTGDGQVLCYFDFTYKLAGSATLPENVNYFLPQVSSYYGATPGTTFVVGTALAKCPASLFGIVPVTDEADVVYLMQGKTGTTYSTASHVGKRANISLTTVGSTVTFISGMAVDGGTIAATATLDLQLFRISQISPNIEAANAIFEVIINKHIFGQQTAGV